MNYFYTALLPRTPTSGAICSSFVAQGLFNMHPRRDGDGTTKVLISDQLSLSQLVVKKPKHTAHVQFDPTGNECLFA